MNKNVLFGWLIFLCGMGLASCADDPAPETFDYNQLIPPGFPAPEIPADNQPNAERFALGRALFYDPVLSADST